MSKIYTFCFTHNIVNVTAESAKTLDYIEKITLSGRKLEIVKTIWEDKNYACIRQLREKAWLALNGSLDYPWILVSDQETLQSTMGIDISELTGKKTILIQDRKELGLCPQCGTEGSWVRMALVCKAHGAYAGC